MGIITGIKAGRQECGAVRATLPRFARILKPFDFKKVFEKNAASTDRCFRVIARPVGRGEHRLGMAVSRKVDRTAVGRNRIKRVIRESFRDWRARPSNHAAPALDIVVLARPASATICNEQLFSSLARHWPALERQADRKFGGAELPEGQ